MSGTPKKGSHFVSCDKCSSIIARKDTAIHDNQCPPSKTDWNHSYIKEEVLHSTIEPYSCQDLPKNITERNTHDMVFLSLSALQICQIAIGDRVLISSKNGAIVRVAWPLTDKTITSVCLTRRTIETTKIEGAVEVKKFAVALPVAKEIEVELVAKHKLQMSSQLQVLMRCQYEKKAVCVGNRLSLPFYGKNLVFKVTKITEEKEENTRESQDLEDVFENLSLQENPEVFYETLYSTKWVIVKGLEDKPSQKFQSDISLAKIGGYHELIDQLKAIMNNHLLQKATSLKGLQTIKAILLHGVEGVGKSSITSAILSEYGVNVFSINTTNIISRFIEKPEAYIQEIFADAKKETPSIILIEEIDSLCPKKSRDYDKNILGTLIKELNDLQKSDAPTLVWSTATNLNLMHPLLRRRGRIDREFEVPTPTPQMRREILNKLTSELPHALTTEDIDQIAFVTHGFVAADLKGLCSQAVTSAMKRHGDEGHLQNREILINYEDFTKALIHVKPSAMKQLLVEIPNVKWSDIGGQSELKLKLQQSVEWPLRHPEAFSRMGIPPPRGVLMFGPPGCSKTMVAKALATESKLNFINVTAPELFSKWVGESEEAVREVFRQARQVAPSIVFIDEIDAIGGERASSSASAGNQVQERVLTQLLTELDGITVQGNVNLVAATNRPDRIDKALLRPGRLDRVVYVPLPDYPTRLEIFEVKFRKMPIAEDVHIHDLVDLTEGYSGAEIQAVCNEAGLKALTDDMNAAVVRKEHFEAALATIQPRTPRSLIDMYEEFNNRMGN